ncbi:MAG: hypothetical protein IJH12_01480 [Clostridia bacterium]|nr:hypothetical protein [Clostridia bacterium]
MEEKKIEVDKKILMKIITILLLIVAITIVASIAVKPNKKDVSRISDTSDSSQTTNINEKKYYDFISTDYYTFNFSERELENIIFDGKNCTYYGFNKSVSTKDSNTSLYSRLTTAQNISGTEILSITTDVSNHKVKSIKYSFVAYNTLSQSEADYILQLALSAALAWCSGYSTMTTVSDEAMNAIDSLIEDINNREINNKGLNVYTLYPDARTVELYIEPIK